MKWLTNYYSQWQTKQLLVEQAELVVLDLELTGLDPRQHEIVSVGWLPIQAGRIAVSKAQYHINKEVTALAQSPVYHGIDADTVAQGETMATILAELHRALTGKVLVCHNLPMDWGFLKAAMRKHHVTIRPKLLVDTLALEKRRILQQGYPLAQDALTLSACRARYGLPAQRSQHNALSDALATAELLLAQVQAISINGKCKVAELT